LSTTLPTLTPLDPDQLATLFQAAPTPLVAATPHGGRILAVNDAFCRLVGRDAADLVGLEAPYPWVLESVGLGSPRSEHHLQDAHGQIVVVEARRVGVSLPDVPDAELWALTDLTERRRFDQQLVQSGKLAAVGELAAGVAHEVNNPLFAILGLTEFLQKDAEPGSKAAERLQMIRESGEEIREIVRALLDFARENPEERQLVPFNHVVRQAVTLMRRTNAHKGVELVATYAEDDRLVLASANQLKQVLLNLISNARQAMPNGGTVWIETRIEDAWATVTVADDGPGVDAALADRVFEPFFSTRGLPAGSGLGLPVSLGIAQAHGGTLTLDRARPRGAAFTLRLPLGEGEETA
jgi:two-component system, NtrC family, sensor kinase